jgi:hypothetical protein
MKQKMSTMDSLINNIPMANTPEITPQNLSDEQLEKLTDKLDITEKQYLLQKRNIDAWQKMSLAAIRSELETYQIKKEAPASTILAKLDVEFPNDTTRKAVPQVVSSSEPIKFTEHPWDWTTNKMSEWIDAITPDRFKKVAEMSKRWAPTTAIVTTAVFWVAAWETAETAAKAIGWWDKLKNDPSAFFKELWDVITSGSWSKIKSFFSSTMESIGITPSIAESFADKIWLPKNLIKSGISLFSSENFGKMNYGDLGQIYKEYQKNPDMNLAKKLGISNAELPEVTKVMETIFGKKSKGIVDIFTANGGTEPDMSAMAMADIIKKII